MTDSSFKVKNTLTINNAIQANSGGIYFSNVLTLNSTSYLGTANNASYLGGTIASSYGNLTITSNASNLTTGKLPFAQLPSQVLVSNAASIITIGVSNLSANYIVFQPTDYGINKPQLFFNSAVNDGSNAQFVIGTYDGNSDPGTLSFTMNKINFNVSTLLRNGSGPILDGASTNQVISGGAIVSSHGIATGNFTANTGICPLQYITNNGAFTITAPSNDGSMILLIQNGTAAGTISYSGFTNGASTGDTLDTTNGHNFMMSIIRINGISTFVIKALQ